MARQQSPRSNNISIRSGITNFPPYSADICWRIVGVPKIMDAGGLLPKIAELCSTVKLATSLDEFRAISRSR